MRGFEWIIILLVVVIPLAVIIALVVKASNAKNRPVQLPPGWLPDATDPKLLRYWDGTQWTEQTAKRE